MTNLHSHSHIRSTSSNEPIVLAFGVCRQIFLFLFFFLTFISYYPAGASPASQDFSARQAGRLLSKQSDPDAYSQSRPRKIGIGPLSLQLGMGLKPAEVLPEH